MSEKTLEALVTDVVNAAFDCGEYSGEERDYFPVLEKSNAAKKALLDFCRATTAQLEEARLLLKSWRTCAGRCRCTKCEIINTTLAAMQKEANG